MKIGSRPPRSLAMNDNDDMNDHHETEDSCNPLTDGERARRRVAWIATVPEAQATGELAEAYAKDRDPATGKVDHILKVHSLLPATLGDHARLYHTILHKPGEVLTYERELIGLVVSNTNGCRY